MLRVLHWGTLSSTQIQVLKVHYCNTVPLKMQNALNTIKLQKISHQCIQLKEKKKKVIKFALFLSVLHVSDMRFSTPTPSFPLTKSSNIYIFNPIKNVRKKKSVHCATRLNISKAHLFCAAVTCIAPKSSSSSRLRLRLPVKETRKDKTNNTTLCSQWKLIFTLQTVV